MTRRGVTLVELLLAVAVLGLLVPVFVGAARAAGAGMRLAVIRLAAERDATAIVGLLGHDLRAAASGDVAIPVATVIEYPRPIGEGLTCLVDAGRPVLRRGGWLATRAPVPGRDRLLVLTTADPAIWVWRQLLALGSHACPDGQPGLLLTPDLPIDSALVVRVVEPVRVRDYGSQGRRWLGLEPLGGGATVQPFAGPLRAGGWQLSGAAGRIDARFAGPGGIAAVLALPLE